MTGCSLNGGFANYIGWSRAFVKKFHGKVLGDGDGGSKVAGTKDRQGVIYKVFAVCHKELVLG
jgi:hypothetical protein